MIKNKQGVVTDTKPWVRKRRRSITSGDELSPRHEAKFQRSEEKAVAQMEGDDSSFKNSSDKG